MGLFSTKKKTVVSTAVVPLLGENNLPDSAKQATFAYIMSNPSVNVAADGYTLGNEIANAVANSLPNKMRKIGRWVRNNDNYAYGNVTTDFIELNKDAVTAYLLDYAKDNYSVTATINYEYFEETRNSHMSWQLLKDSYGYNTTTNELTNLSAFYGVPVYLEDGEIVYCQFTIDDVYDPSTLNTFGLAYTHGYTPIRTKDYSRTIKDYAVATDTHDKFNFKVFIRLEKTQVIVKDIPTSNIDSDTTTYNGVVPTTYESITTTITSDTTSILGSKETRTIVSDVDYIVEVSTNFLIYEYSGEFDESNALDDSDMENIDPSAEDTTTLESYDSPDYFMAQFIYTVGSDTYYEYFTYKYGSGTNSTLDSIFTTGSTVGKYFPRIYLRMNGQKLNNDSFHTTDEYKDSVKYCKKIGLDYEMLCDKVHESVGSLEHVKQISIGLHCPATPKNEYQIEYLFNYFLYMHAFMPTMVVGSKNNAAAYFKTLYSEYNLRDGKLQLYKDNVYEQRFKFEQIGYKLITGVIGEVGKCTFEGKTVSSIGFFDKSTTYVHLYRKQVNETQYTEVVVHEMSSAELVQSGYLTTAARSSENLLVPFEQDISRILAPRKREQLYGSCQVIILNTSQVIKTPWYARGAFKALTFIIAVLLAIPSGGQSLTLWSVVYAVTTVVVLSLAIKLTIDLLVNYGGMDEKDATILANFLAIITFNFNALAAFSQTVKAYTDTLKLEYQDVMKQMEYLNNDIEEKQKMLDEAYKLLKETQYVYDPLYTFTRNNFIELGQSVSSFMYRSLNITSVNQLLLAYPTAYVSASLLLPKA